MNSFENKPGIVAVVCNRFVGWLAGNVAFISWHKHWKGVYLHCVHPTHCVRLFAWGVDWHPKAKHALRKPANNAICHGRAQP